MRDDVVNYAIKPHLLLIFTLFIHPYNITHNMLRAYCKLCIYIYIMNETRDQEREG